MDKQRLSKILNDHVQICSRIKLLHNLKGFLYGLTFCVTFLVGFMAANFGILLIFDPLCAFLKSRDANYAATLIGVVIFAAGMAILFLYKIVKRKSKFHFLCAQTLKKTIIQKDEIPILLENRYAVYLRNFVAEFFQYYYLQSEPQHAEDHVGGWTVDIVPESRQPDSGIIEILNQHMPVICIGNRNDPVPPERLYKLYANDNDWLATVEFLVSHAAVTVIYLVEFSQGLFEELKLLANSDAKCRTVILTTNLKLVNRIKDMGFQRVILVPEIDTKPGRSEEPKVFHPHFKSRKESKVS